MEFYSNGKLLISGEYVVLDGALAFALPTKFGQSLQVEQIEEPVLYWTSYDVDGQVWMKEQVDLVHVVQETNLEGSAYLLTLVDVLRVAHRLNPFVLEQSGGFKVESRLTFPRLWGLGTSSTWINNVAQWFEINPYQLLRESFGGSGYDIACAQHDCALFYQVVDPLNPIVDLLEFEPAFTNQLYFVYLNQKQSSKTAIAAYKAKKGGLQKEIQRITEISKALSTTTEVTVFKALLVEHEKIMGVLLDTPPIQERLFADFNGVIKSLGAWGGDFVLVVSQEDPTDYFQQKGYHTIVTYQAMIK
ncbi:GYDIA family GHMP kinase [Myroides fluvii]|uniref:GYDIA family GHMP kinase n=1 Tax=Myroides fluvii TaxID=2572594 RepID=UPI00131E4A43|nr:GYDIA family GHMP kinase [Myroides fluvii]